MKKNNHAKKDVDTTISFIPTVIESVAADTAACIRSKSIKTVSILPCSAALCRGVLPDTKRLSASTLTGGGECIGSVHVIGITRKASVAKVAQGPCLTGDELHSPQGASPRPKKKKKGTKNRIYSIYSILVLSSGRLATGLECAMCRRPEERICTHRPEIRSSTPK